MDIWLIETMFLWVLSQPEIEIKIQPIQLSYMSSCSFSPNKINIVNVLFSIQFQVTLFDIFVNYEVVYDFSIWLKEMLRNGFRQLGLVKDIQCMVWH